MGLKGLGFPKIRGIIAGPAYKDHILGSHICGSYHLEHPSNKTPALYEYEILVHIST